MSQVFSAVTADLPSVRPHDAHQTAKAIHRLYDLGNQHGVLTFAVRQLADGNLDARQQPVCGLTFLIGHDGYRLLA